MVFDTFTRVDYAFIVDLFRENVIYHYSSIYKLVKRNAIIHNRQPPSALAIGCTINYIHSITYIPKPIKIINHKYILKSNKVPNSECVLAWVECKATRTITDFLFFELKDITDNENLFVVHFLQSLYSELAYTIPSEIASTTKFYNFTDSKVCITSGVGRDQNRNNENNKINKYFDGIRTFHDLSYNQLKLSLFNYLRNRGGKNISN